MGKQHKKSLITERIIVDANNNKSRPKNFRVSKSLIRYARNARSRYRELQKKQVKDQEDSDKSHAAQKRMAAAIKKLEEKRAKIMAETLRDSARIDRRGHSEAEAVKMLRTSPPSFENKNKV